ncbi:alpha/beta hydrolase fold domain-containing protein [Prosthecobacter sp.]|uniref:alpha/beta hydrolase fold domain-containing protein n=1 Tax=Prosthecobacter sp. TaxID=1965333 RepID=UPI00378474ED
MGVPLCLLLGAFHFAAQVAAQPGAQTDVRYGKHDNDVLDFHPAQTKGPAPVLINYHGGGWTGGDKKSFNPAPLLRVGISVVSANYRFTTGTKDSAPYPAPMLDAARVVQFVRSKAAEWHIDPQRIALTGDSAGAVNAMWIAYREDMAKADASDPVERFSTRVTCVVPVIGPTTLDPKVILARVGGSPTIHPAMPMFFGVKSLDELNTPEMQKVIDDASPLTHVTKDDPPTFMRYASPLGGTPFPAATSPNITIHHPEFGAMLKEKLDALGIENVLQTKDDGSDPQAMWIFLFKHLKPERAPPAK